MPPVPLSAESLGQALVRAASCGTNVRVHVTSPAESGDIWLSDRHIVYVRSQRGLQFGLPALKHLLLLEEASFAWSPYDASSFIERGRLNVPLELILDAVQTFGPGGTAQSSASGVQAPPELLSRIEAVLDNSEERPTDDATADIVEGPGSTDSDGVDVWEIQSADKNILHPADPQVDRLIVVDRLDFLKAPFAEPQAGKGDRPDANRRLGKIAKYLAFAGAVGICLALWVFLAGQQPSSQESNLTPVKQLVPVIAERRQPQKPFSLPRSTAQPPAPSSSPANAQDGPVYTKEDYVAMQKYLEKARTLAAQGRSEEAARVYMEGLHKYPRFMMMRLYAVRVLLSLGRFADARTVCSDGLQLQPTAAEQAALEQLLSRCR